MPYNVDCPEQMRF